MGRKERFPKTRDGQTLMTTSPTTNFVPRIASQLETQIPGWLRHGSTVVDRIDAFTSNSHGRDGLGSYAIMVQPSTPSQVASVQNLSLPKDPSPLNKRVSGVQLDYSVRLYPKDIMECPSLSSVGQSPEGRSMCCHFPHPRHVHANSLDDCCKPSKPVSLVSLSTHA